MGNSSVFQRVEKKYKLTREQKEQLFQEIGHRLIPDEHGQSTILSLYLDTPDHRIIRDSVEAKGRSVYKEKIRVRSYGVPGKNDKVFFELKKKYKGIVYKRRVCMTLAEAEDYMKTGTVPKPSQIMSEIDYAMSFYGRPQPSMLLCYEREAFTVEGESELRLTFDSNIRYRQTELDLNQGSQGWPVMEEDAYLLEIKTEGSMPLWLTQALDHHKIFPSSFSKYGTAYQKTLREENDAEALTGRELQNVINL